MGYASSALLMMAAAAGFFFVMVVFMEAGRRLGVRQFAKRGEAARSGVGVVDGPIFGLLSLLLGFTFSGAAGRFDHRRELIAGEVEMARTVWSRIETLPENLRHPVRVAMREYIDAVLATYAYAPGTAEAKAERERTAAAHQGLWDAAVSACIAQGGESARMLLLPSLSLMFEAVEEEHLSQRIHPSVAIWVMLLFTASAAALFGGYRMAAGTARNWIPVVGVSAAMSVALFVILELESPRLGWVRVDDMDQALVELRATMNGGTAAPSVAADQSRSESAAAM